MKYGAKFLSDMCILICGFALWRAKSEGELGTEGLLPP